MTTRNHSRRPILDLVQSARFVDDAIRAARVELDDVASRIVALPRGAILPRSLGDALARATGRLLSLEADRARLAEEIEADTRTDQTVPVRVVSV
jgi:hypothetical protein